MERDAGETYLRDYEYKIGRNAVRIPVRTVEKLYARIGCGARVPARIASDLHEVLREIERDARVAKVLRPMKIL